MTEPRSFASLSSGLLARKGGAKPAMRPQGFGQMGMGMEDLGWNDMGYAPQSPDQSFEDMAPEHVPSSIAALTPAPRPAAADDSAIPQAPPPVVEQQRAIAASFGDSDAASRAKPRPTASVVALAPQAKAPNVKVEAGSKAKTAFTLRLDAERHLRLRLACAVTRQSAQQLVCGALDEYLGSLPELTAMAQQMPAKFGKRS